MAPKRLSRADKGKAVAQPSAAPDLHLMMGITKEEKERYKANASKIILPNKIPSSFMLETLGLNDEIRAFLSNLGWNDFIFRPEPGYEEVVREFMCTVQLSRKSDSKAGQYGLVFRCFGDPYFITFDQISSLFTLQVGEHIPFIISALDVIYSEFWAEISIETKHNPKTSIAKHIKSLPLWLLHRIVTFSVNARGDGNEKVSQKDLAFLYCLVHNKPIQTGRYLVDQLIHMSTKPKSQFLLPSHITAIYRFVGALNEDNEKFLAKKLLPSHNFLDINYLVNAKAIHPDTHLYTLGASGARKMESSQASKRKRLIIEEEPQQPIPPKPKSKSKLSLATINSKLDKLMRMMRRKTLFLSHLHSDMVDIQEKLGIPSCHLPDFTEFDDTQDEAEDDQVEEGDEAEGDGEGNEDEDVEEIRGDDSPIF